MANASAVARFRYRAAAASGRIESGVIEAGSTADAVVRLQRKGLRPIETVAEKAGAASPAQPKRNRAAMVAATKAFGELAVLLDAGLPLDRALVITVENMAGSPAQPALALLLARVKEGVPLSRAIAEAGAAFPPMAAPMAEAGEANGRLGEALGKLAETLERAEALRQSVVSAMIYPVLLTCVSVLVILGMLLFVVPQFEGLFGGAVDRLPPATRFVMGLSRFVRESGLWLLLGLVAGGFGVRQWARQPATRRMLDRRILTMPKIGPLLTRIETARLARVLGSLVDGGVPLPNALDLARRTLANSHFSNAVGGVAEGLKQGGGLSGPLAATGLFPRLALSFIRTGEETARLGPMLGRLADVLDQEVKIALGRIVALLTPAITIAMGVIVAGLIGSIMSAILGFNEMAMTQ